MQKINGNFYHKDILSLDQFSQKDLSILFAHAKKMKTFASNLRPLKLLNGYVVTLLFYEPSSRTFGSFSGAVKRTGGQTIEIQNPAQVSSVAKGETLEDTIKTFESYSECIVMRHPIAGSAKKAADAASIPVINAGDGTGEHPTQALLDMYTIHQHFKRLNNITVVFGGDMLNGRTVHSLLRALSLYKNNTAFLLSPKNLRLSKEDFSSIEKKGVKLIEIHNEKDIPKKADVWYWTRVQKERFANLEEYEKVKHSFIVNPQFLAKYGNKNMILMHPLPRVGEIDPSVDADKRSVYLEKQMRNGMYVRMALVALILGKIK